MDVPRALETARIWSRGPAEARKAFHQLGGLVDEDHRQRLIVEVTIELFGQKHGGSAEDIADLENLLVVAQNVECGSEA